MYADSDTSLFDSDEEIAPKRIIADDLNDGDVIAETPQKIKKQKNLKNRGRTSKTESIYDTPEVSQVITNNSKISLSEFYVTRNDTSFMHLNYHEVNLSDGYKRPYVFFEIGEILNFTEFYQPVNIRLKTLGTYKQQSINRHCLMEHKKVPKITPHSINLDMKLLETFPTDGTRIEIYGFLSFQNKTSFCLPVFAVEFWTSVAVDYDRYSKCLKRQKIYVPSCYKNVRNFDQNLSYLEYVDYTFEEIDESCLNRNVEHIEQICCEIDQIMNISDDVFV